MALSDKPNLKPIRDYNENEVVNGLYTPAPAFTPLNKGTFVTITRGYGNTNVTTTGSGITVTPLVGLAGSAPGTPSYATSQIASVYGQVSPALSGQPVLGMTLRDVREFDIYGESYRYKSQDYRNQREVVLSGQSVPIVKRGIFSTNNFSGTPSAMTGAYVSQGVLVPCPYNKVLFPQVVGYFHGGADADGYAKFQIEL